MTTLRDLNREEWADKPFLIELRGGRADGKRFRWRELPLAWKQPEPAAVDLTMDLHAAPQPMVMPVSLYRQTGSVTDDGAHIYEFERFD